MNTWPVNLKILRSGYSEKPVSRSLRSSMDVGPAKVRRRTVLNIIEIDGNMLLTDADYKTFETFYFENESIPFVFYNVLKSESAVARFRAPFQSSMNETMWNVSIQLEMLP